MLPDLIAATCAPTAPSPHDAYDWWSGIVLPAIVGVGSVLVAVVAIRVASRSNALAAAATSAAETSNAIAERSIQQDAERAEEQRAEHARQERRRLGDRFLVHVDELSAEIHADPMIWSKPIDEVGDNALFRMSPVIFEAATRGWTDFPSTTAVELVQSGAKAGGGARRTQLARNAAHSVINFWVEDPSTAVPMIAFVKHDMEKRLA